MTFTSVSCTSVERHGAAAAAAAVAAGGGVSPVRRVRGARRRALGHIQLQLSGIPAVPITAAHS